MSANRNNNHSKHDKKGNEAVKLIFHTIVWISQNAIDDVDALHSNSCLRDKHQMLQGYMCCSKMWIRNLHFPKKRKKVSSDPFKCYSFHHLERIHMNSSDSNNAIKLLLETSSTYVTGNPKPYLDRTYTRRLDNYNVYKQILTE